MFAKTSWNFFQLFGQWSFFKKIRSWREVFSEERPVTSALESNKSTEMYIGHLIRWIDRVVFMENIASQDQNEFPSEDRVSNQ